MKKENELEFYKEHVGILQHDLRKAMNDRDTWYSAYFNLLDSIKTLVSTTEGSRLDEILLKMSPKTAMRMESDIYKGRIK